MMLHLHPSSYDDEACISMLEGVVGYGDGDLAVVGTVREVILYMLLMLLLLNKNTYKQQQEGESCRD
jgi:hypothetical protein